MSRKSKWHNTEIDHWSDRKKAKRKQVFDRKHQEPQEQSELRNDIRRALSWSASHDDDLGINFNGQD